MGVGIFDPLIRDEPKAVKKWELPTEVAIVGALVVLSFFARAGFDLILFAGVAGVSYFAGRRSKS